MLEDQVAAALRRIPLYQDMDLAGVTAERLGGLTNLVYRVRSPRGLDCLRIAGAGTEEYIDRAVEGHNAQLAATAGVSPEVLFFDPADGLMLTTYIDGFETMTPETFPTKPGAATRAALAFKTLHGSGETFRFRFEVFAMIDDYLKVLDGKSGVLLPAGYHEVVKQAEGLRDALNRDPVALAPCHCDPLCENFLDDGQRMWIVDWEYSGMNDPFWDLGDLSVEAGFGPDQDREMMTAYCGGDAPAALFGRMVIYKALCDLLWTLWGLIQHANDNPVDDFWAYATGRFARCQRLMADPAFAGHVAAV